MLNHIPKKHVVAALIISAFIIFTLLAGPSPDADANTPSSRITTELTLDTARINSTVTPSALLETQLKQPIPKPLVVSSTTATPPKNITNSFKIKRGDTLSSLFSKAGFDNTRMYKVLHADIDNQFRRIHPKQIITFTSSPNQQLLSVELKKNILIQYKIALNEKGNYESKLTQRIPETTTDYISGTISDSLFLDGEKAGLTQKQIMKLTSIFGWEIDFALDLRKDDKFSILFEKRYLDGKRISNGKILVATFTNKGTAHKAILFKQKNGSENYFTPNGSSLRTAFLRTPIPLARVSSHFNLSRKHPVLHTIRAHKGTDYAASTGTPIRSTGDGRVISAGWKGGYGRAVVIKHGHNISTLYAHMSRYKKGVRAGTKVKQGQTVGYVGQSGLATGPHLHYEFRVNGIQRDAERVKFPHASAVPRQQLAQFKQHSAVYLAQLKTFEDSYTVASNP